GGDRIEDRPDVPRRDLGPRRGARRPWRENPRPLRVRGDAPRPARALERSATPARARRFDGPARRYPPDGSRSSRAPDSAQSPGNFSALAARPRGCRLLLRSALDLSRARLGAPFRRDEGWIQVHRPASTRALRAPLRSGRAPQPGPAEDRRRPGSAPAPALFERDRHSVVRFERDGREAPEPGLS